VIFGDGFPTKNGRARFVPTGLVPPDEVPDNEFPMILTTGRLLEHWHTGTMTRRSLVLDDLEPEAVAHMNPDDIKRHGLKPGGMVTVATRRGSISLKVRADQGVGTGVVFIPFCFAEAPANELTNPALDPFGKIPELKYCAARIEHSGHAAAGKPASCKHRRGCLRRLNRTAARLTAPLNAPGQRYALRRRRP
jgi:formate dehydrogenase major subunit